MTAEPPDIHHPGNLDPGNPDPAILDPGLPDPGLLDPGLLDPAILDPAFLDPDRAQAYLRDWQSRVDRKAAETTAMSARLGRMRARGTDDNDLVEVTIDAAGGLVDVRFSDRIQRVAPGAVSRAVLSALRVARLAAARQTHEIVVDTMGAESVAGQTIAARLERQLIDSNGN